MAATPTSHAHHTAASDLPTLLASRRWHLAAQRLSPATLPTYSAAVRGLDAFLADRVTPRAVTLIQPTASTRRPTPDRAETQDGHRSPARPDPSIPLLMMTKTVGGRRSLLDRNDLVLNTATGRVNPTRQHPVRSLKGSHQS